MKRSICTYVCSMFGAAGHPERGMALVEVNCAGVGRISALGKLGCNGGKYCT